MTWLTGHGGTEGGYSLLKKWVPSPPTFITGTAFLFAVSCESATTCDAVGNGTNNQGVVATTPA